MHFSDALINIISPHYSPVKGLRGRHFKYSIFLHTTEGEEIDWDGRLRSLPPVETKELCVVHLTDETLR